VDEDVAVEAATADVVLPDSDHVQRGAALDALRRIARLVVEEVLLLGEQRVVSALGRDRDRRRDQHRGQHDHGGQHRPFHSFPLLTRL